MTIMNISLCRALLRLPGELSLIDTNSRQSQSGLPRLQLHPVRPKSIPGPWTVPVTANTKIGSLLCVTVGWKKIQHCFRGVFAGSQFGVKLEICDVRVSALPCNARCQSGSITILATLPTTISSTVLRLHLPVFLHLYIRPKSRLFVPERDDWALTSASEHERFIFSSLRTTFISVEAVAEIVEVVEMAFLELGDVILARGEGLEEDVDLVDYFSSNSEFQFLTDIFAVNDTYSTSSLH